MVVQIFTREVIGIIKSIPKGKVLTYGHVAKMAGSPKAARQVVRVLHSSSKKENLPWHRVVNREGKISLKPGKGFEEQKILLESEGVVFDNNGNIDLNIFLWEFKNS